MLDLDAIEARAEAATPGDHWFADLEPEDQLSYEVWAAQDPDEESSNGVVTEFGCKKADAYFIAHARVDIPALVAELRNAREVVEAAHKWKIALTWDAEWSIRPAEVGSTLQRKSELLEALAAPAGAHVHYDDFYDPAGELDDDFDAYRAVVGEQE